MAKYIDADKLKKAFDQTSAREDGYYPNNVVDSIPAADVVKVVRGKWRTLYAKRTVPVRTDGYVCRPVECSICGQYLIGSGDYSVYGRFCPCCGAKMRGESDERLY